MCEANRKHGSAPTQAKIRQKPPAWVHEVLAAQEQLQDDRASNKNGGSECDDFNGEEEADSTVTGGHRQPDTAIGLLHMMERGAWRLLARCGPTCQQRVEEELGSDAWTSLRHCDVA